MGLHQRSTIQLLGYLGLVAAVSFIVAALITPLVPYPFFKVLRRAATIVAAVLLVPFVRRVQQRSLADLGLEWSARMRQQWLQGVLLGVALFSGLLVAHGLCGTVTFHWPTGRGWLTLLAFVPAALVIAVLEELFFRGVVFQSLLPDVGVTMSMLLSSALYAILHFVKYLAQPLSILPELLGLFLLGCVFAWAYVRTRRLALAIGLHMSLAYLARVDRQFLDFIGREPRWVFGTDHWVTGLMGWAMLALAWVCITQWTRTATMQRGGTR